MSACCHATPNCRSTRLPPHQLIVRQDKPAVFCTIWALRRAVATRTFLTHKDRPRLVEGIHRNTNAGGHAWTCKHAVDWATCLASVRFLWASSASARPRRAQPLSGCRSRSLLYTCSHHVASPSQLHPSHALCTGRNRLSLRLTKSISGRTSRPTANPSSHLGRRRNRLNLTASLCCKSQLIDVTRCRRSRLGFLNRAVMRETLGQTKF